MNKISKLMWTLLPMLSIFLFVACNDDEPAPTEGTSAINLKATTVDAVANGGEYTVNYTITNPVEGQNVTVVPADAWITNVDVATAGVIKFTVERNSTEAARETTVDVSYKGAAKQTFTVKQAAALAQNLTFDIELTEPGYFSCLLDIYPSDQDTPYIYNIYSPGEIEAYGLETDEAMFAYEFEYFATLGYWNNLTAAEIAEERMKFGNQYDVEPSGLCPESTYYLIAYYYDPDTQQRLSDITRFEFTTPAVDLGEMEFTFEHTVDGNYIDATVTAPGTYTDPFYFDVFEKSVVDSECAQLGIDPARYFQLYNDKFVANLLAGGQYTSTGYINEYCSYMSDSFTFDLLQNTEYYLYAFAVNEYGLCATTPQYVTVKTDKVEMSDNQITIVIRDITTNSSTILWRTTNDDPYVAGIVEKSEWDKYGTTDRAILDSLLKTLELNTLTGDQTYAPKTAAEYYAPGTEYVVFAFGFRGGVVTTDLFTKTFTTLEDRESTMILTRKDLGYFSVESILQVDANVGNYYDDYPDWNVIAPMDYSVSDSSMLKSFYYTNWVLNPNAEPGWNSPENIIAMVLHDGARSMYLNYAFSTYGLETYAWAIACDNEGYYTALNEYVFTPTTEGLNTDAQVFVDWFYEQQNKDNALVPSAVYSNVENVPVANLAHRALVAPTLNQGKKLSSYVATETPIGVNELSTRR